MKRYISLTEKQRVVLNKIYNHNCNPIVKVSEYKKHGIATRTLNCLIEKGLIEIVTKKNIEYYYRTERGRIVSCCNINHNIDTTLGDYFKMVVAYNKKK